MYESEENVNRTMQTLMYLCVLELSDTVFDIHICTSHTKLIPFRLKIRSASRWQRPSLTLLILFPLSGFCTHKQDELFLKSQENYPMLCANLSL